MDAVPRNMLGHLRTGWLSEIMLKVGRGGQREAGVVLGLRERVRVPRRRSEAFWRRRHGASLRRGRGLRQAADKRYLLLRGQERRAGLGLGAARVGGDREGDEDRRHRCLGGPSGPRAEPRGLREDVADGAASSHKGRQGGKQDAVGEREGMDHAGQVRFIQEGRKALDVHRASPSLELEDDPVRARDQLGRAFHAMPPRGNPNRSAVQRGERQPCRGFRPERGRRPVDRQG